MKIINLESFFVNIKERCVTFLFVDEEEPQIREVVEEEVLEEDPIDDDEEEAVVQAAPAQPEVGFSYYDVISNYVTRRLRQPKKLLRPRF